MKKLPLFCISFAVVFSLAVSPSAQAKVKAAELAAPTVTKVSSSSVTRGKVNITVTIKLPAKIRGVKNIGSKVTAGGKSCLIKIGKTSCTIKGLKSGKALNVRTQSKNKMGYGAKSKAINYVAGSPTYRLPVIANAQVSQVNLEPNSTSVPSTSAEPTSTSTIINTSAIAGLSIPLPGNAPDTSVNSGVGYTASVAWSPNPVTFVSNTSYTATITLTADPDFTFTGVAANFFTVAGTSSDSNPVNSGIVTAVFPVVVYAIGDVGPAGGSIFITPSTAGNTTGKYFEAAAADLDSTKSWCNITSSVGTTGTAIGAGRTNTNLITAACTSGAGQDAVDYAVTTNAITYTDWFLPSQDELNELCLFSKVTRPGTSTCASETLKSGFATNGFYSSSSEVLSSSMHGQVLTTGDKEFSDKSFPAYVRVVREFN